MSNSTNQLTFRVAGNDVISFMDTVKKKQTEMLSDMIKNARTQGDSAKEQLKIINEQIAATERKSRIEIESARRVAAETRDNNIAKHKSDYENKISTIHDEFANGKISASRRDSKMRTAGRLFDDSVEQEHSGFKGQLGVLRENEKASSLQTKILRDLLGEVRQSAQAQLQQMRTDTEDITRELDENATPIEQFTRDIASERYLNEGRGEPKEEKKGSTARDVIGGMFGVDNINKMGQTLSQFAGTQNGFDMIAPASRGVGQIVGSLLGGLIGGLTTGGVGALAGAGVGGSIGATFGGGIGEFEQRKAMAAQDFLHNKNSYEATTGRSISEVPSMAGMGVSASDFLGALKQIAVAAGGSKKAIEQAADAIEMEKGLGVDRGVSQQLITFFRGTNKDISNLVAGVMAKGKNGLFAGGDNTFLNEFLGKFDQLHQTLLQTQEKVATGSTFDILNRFNSMGGQFAARDPRSLGLISTINNSLVNPTSDSSSAAAFLALRRSNPNLGISGLIEERQKGLASPTYMKSMLQYIESIGGSEDFKIMNTAGMFGLNGNMAAARRLHQHRNEIMKGNMSQQQIEEVYSGDFASKATEKTTALEKNTADIKDGLLQGWYQTLDAMSDSFKTAMESAFNGATIEMSNGKLHFGSTVIKNATKKAQVKQAKIEQNAKTMNTWGMGGDPSMAM